ncbi:D-hexose-6-phosphate mutarotase [Pseudaeromonas paramecii]|uniref:Putative glucose-6-phosphate 1-epimerase n=1 Tax=Pseudaeromonas paramecii TaxID=2138166 RepID=A0ABP8Q5R4_9GAMM
MIEQLKLTALQPLTTHTKLARNETDQRFIVVDHPDYQAILALYGGHLIHYSNHGSPLLWLSQSALLDGSRPIRGGVPLCWPWFGPSPERVGLGKPQHGFARTQLWTLDGISETAESTFVHLCLSDNAASQALWPHAFELELTLEIGSELTMLLTTRNTGASPFVYSGALHTYFQSQAPEAVQIQGLGNTYLDQLQQKRPTQEASFVLDKPVDRIYTEPDSRIELDTGLARLQLLNHQADSVVVWNPWQAGAAAMADFDDQGWQTMICVESAITAPDGIQVEPDEEHSLGFTLRRAP